MSNPTFPTPESALKELQQKPVKDRTPRRITMLPDEPTTAAPAAPKVTTVFVKVKREVDLGFAPFQKVARHYLRQKQQIPFGMRDASRTSFEISLTAEVGDGDPEAVIADLTSKANAIADREMRVSNPETFEQARQLEAPEEAFVVGSTVVTTDTRTDGEDY